MARFRTAAAAAIFLFDSTFLWCMSSFLGTGTTVYGAIWSVIQILVLATVVVLAGAAWGLDEASGWKRLATDGLVLAMTVLPSALSAQVQDAQQGLQFLAVEGQLA